MAATAQVTVPEINTKILALKDAGLPVEAICRHLKVTDKEILAVLKSQGIPRLWTAKNKWDVMCQSYWHAYTSNSDEAWFLASILESELDLQPMFDTISCVWRELLEQTATGKLVRVGLLANGGNTNWEHNIGFEEMSNESPSCRYELSQLFSRLLIRRYNVLAKPFKNTEQVLARFRVEISDRVWNVFALRFGFFSEHPEPLSLEEVAVETGFTRARVRQMEAKALRTLRKSEALKDLWEPFVRLRKS